MIKLDREQLLSTGVLAALLLACIIAIAVSFQMRSNAVQDLADRSELLSRIEARAKASNDARARSGAVAPAAAFLDAATQGLAGAQLQAHVEQMASVHHAVLISSSIEPAKREDPPDSIRLQATVDLSLQALQTLLYQLESGTPYVFVDSLAVQISGATTQHATEDPLLRISFGLRAVWRRGKA
jgi:general secretion pathway protein M